MTDESMWSVSFSGYAAYSRIRNDDDSGVYVFEKIVKGLQNQISILHVTTRF